MPHPENLLHVHVPEERASEFLAENGGTMEEEYRDVVKALIRARKPKQFLEVGTGAASPLWVRVCKEVGAHFWAIEPSQEFFEALTWMQSPQVTLLYGTLESNTGNLPSEPFDMILIDSELERRGAELESLINRGVVHDKTIIVIHDTSPLRTIPSVHGPIPDPASRVFWADFKRVAEAASIQWVNLPLSRGLTIAQRHL